MTPEEQQSKQDFKNALEQYITYAVVQQSLAKNDKKPDEFTQAEVKETEKFISAVVPMLQQLENVDTFKKLYDLKGTLNEFLSNFEKSQRNEEISSFIPQTGHAALASIASKILKNPEVARDLGIANQEQDSLGQYYSSIHSKEGKEKYAKADGQGKAEIVEERKRLTTDVNNVASRITETVSNKENSKETSQQQQKPRVSGIIGDDGTIYPDIETYNRVKAKREEQAKLKSELENEQVSPEMRGKAEEVYFSNAETARKNIRKNLLIDFVVNERQIDYFLKNGITQQTGGVSLEVMQATSGKMAQLISACENTSIPLSLIVEKMQTLQGSVSYRYTDVMAFGENQYFRQNNIIQDLVSETIVSDGKSKTPELAGTARIIFDEFNSNWYDAAENDKESEDEYYKRRYQELLPVREKFDEDFTKYAEGMLGEYKLRINQTRETTQKTTEQTQSVPKPKYTPVPPQPKAQTAPEKPKEQENSQETQRDEAWHEAQKRNPVNQAQQKKSSHQEYVYDKYGHPYTRADWEKRQSERTVKERAYTRSEAEAMHSKPLDFSTVPTPDSTNDMFGNPVSMPENKTGSIFTSVINSVKGVYESAYSYFEKTKIMPVVQDFMNNVSKVFSNEQTQSQPGITQAGLAKLKAEYDIAQRNATFNFGGADTTKDPKAAAAWDRANDLAAQVARAERQLNPRVNEPRLANTEGPEQQR